MIELMENDINVDDITHIAGKFSWNVAIFHGV